MAPFAKVVAGFLIFVLTGCAEYEICGGPANKCCTLDNGGGSNKVSFCTADCLTGCQEKAGGGFASCPSEESGWKDTYSAEGCKTGKRNKRTIFGQLQDTDRMTPIPRVIRAQFSDNPLDCTAICADSGSAFCSSAVTDPKVGSQLRTLDGEIRQTRSGAISMTRVHSIFGVKAADDPCNRGSIELGPNTISNDGVFECRIETELAIGNKDVGLRLYMPPRLRGARVSHPHDLIAQFNEVANSARIEIDDQGLQEKYGGSIRAVRVSGSTSYFTMPNACIKIGLDQ